MGALRPKQAEPGSPLAESADAFRNAQALPIQYTPDGYIFYELHVVSHGPDSLPEIQFGRRSSKSTGLKHYITTDGDLIRISEKPNLIPVQRECVEPDFPVSLMHQIDLSSSPSLVPTRPGFFARLFGVLFKSRTMRAPQPPSGSSWDHDLERGIQSEDTIHNAAKSGGFVGWMRGLWSNMTGL
ncbi:hypothetical protein OBBRIDRAFT_279159 [Obba rivulosa]|uniref:Uncharacterized protein n=1 Tax=Obba rivulosa TaxID=1052685 RepID=A0A8E2DQ20_9APHY|nr:hypothetical protein OBBRIDRAFT_279159 [Obba rivulosa]